MNKPKINHMAIWVLALVVQPLPMLWYDNMLFGIRWAELNNLSEADFESFNPINFLWAIFAAVALGYILAYLFRALNITKAIDGLKWAALFWFGLLFMELATQNAFTLRSFELTILDTLIVLFKYEIMAIGIVLWKRKVKTEPTNA